MSAPTNTTNNTNHYPYSTDTRLCSECGGEHASVERSVCVYCEVDAITAPYAAKVAERRAAR